jgi:hypothetical protein
MDSVSSMEKVTGRIHSIEARMDSLALEFERLQGPDFSFRGKLDEARKTPAIPNPLLNLGTGLQSSENIRMLTQGIFESGDDEENSDAFGQLINNTKLRSSLGALQSEMLFPGGRSSLPFNSMSGSLRGSKTKMMLDTYRNVNRQVGREAGSGKMDSLAETARTDPTKIIRFDGFDMQAYTALKYRDLKELIEKEFPGRGVHITSTMGGRHMSPAHPDGRAVDFVVDNLTVEESKVVEQLARDVGFHVFNEYIHDSPYKTGPHMHVEL